MTEEILASIAREVPEYARPLEGSFGRGVQRGVAAALRGFTELLRDPDGQGGAAGDVYVELGRGELRQGRTLDSLQAAYRVGARAAWRRLAQASLRAGVDAQALSLLAEAIFAYIDRISADSVEGYAEAQSEREGERQRHRRRLLAALLAEQPPLEEELARLARDAAWEPPLLAAALACVETDRAALQRRLPAGTLAGTIEGRGCVVVADPEGPAARGMLERASAGLLVAAGSPAALTGLRASWRSAVDSLSGAEVGLLPAERRPIRADDHLASLILMREGGLASRLGELRLRPLGELTAGARARLEQTALAYLRERGNAAAAARALGIHPQTARYRLTQLRQLLGEQLDDPDGRFELELALRARELSGRRSRSGA